MNVCIHLTVRKPFLQEAYPGSRFLPWLQVWVSTRLHCSVLGYAADVPRTWHYFLLSYLESLTDNKIYSFLVMVF